MKGKILPSGYHSDTPIGQILGWSLIFIIIVGGVYQIVENHINITKGDTQDKTVTDLSNRVTTLEKLLNKS